MITETGHVHRIWHAREKATASQQDQRQSLTAFTRPVYFALGALSNPDDYGEIAERLARVFPDFRLEVFEQRHHFDPPHRIEPQRLAASPHATWQHADSGQPHAE